MIILASNSFFFIKLKKPWIRQNWSVLLEKHRHTGRERLQALLEILEWTSTNYQEGSDET